MKLLFAVPHYYKPSAQGHGSMEARPHKRIAALSELILSLHQHFGQQQCEIDIYNRQALPANQALSHQVDIAICTTAEHHLLNQLPVPKTLYRHHPTQAEPLKLGFECHKLLAQALGQYDYYCFLEDDLVIGDPLFFEKLSQFNTQTDLLALLQPNRFELGMNTHFLKAYVDGDIRPGATETFQDVQDKSYLRLNLLGMTVSCKRPFNPHSGCFFLSDTQLDHWVHQPHFLDLDTRFISPLESAATLGIMKTFRVYKSVSAQASFFEIKHADPRFIQLIGREVAVGKSDRTYESAPFVDLCLHRFDIT